MNICLPHSLVLASWSLHKLASSSQSHLHLSITADLFTSLTVELETKPICKQATPPKACLSPPAISRQAFHLLLYIPRISKQKQKPISYIPWLPTRFPPTESQMVLAPEPSTHCQDRVPGDPLRSSASLPHRVKPDRCPDPRPPLQAFTSGLG